MALPGSVVALGLVIGAGAAAWALPVPVFPALSGASAVGTTVLQWTDPARGEAATPDAGDRRAVVVQLWYPAQRVAPDAVRAQYLGRNRREAEIVADGVADYLGVPGFLLDGPTRARTHAVVGAQPATGRFPVVLFSPGLGGVRTQNTAWAEELASRGYVVAGVDHPYDSAAVVLADGSTVRTRIAASGDRTEDNRRRISWTSVRAADLSFVLTQLGRLDKGDPAGRGEEGDAAGRGEEGDAAGRGGMGDAAGRGGMGDPAGRGGMGEPAGRGGMGEPAGRGGKAAFDHRAPADGGEPGRAGGGVGGGEEGVAGELAGRLDVGRAAVTGHSLGGAAAVRAAQGDPRFKAVIDLDGGLDTDQKAVRQPVLVVTHEIRDRADADYVARVMTVLEGGGAGGYRLTVPGSAHLTFTDAPLYLPPVPSLVGSLGGNGSVRMTVETSAAFLDATLGGRTVDLSAALAKYGELSVRQPAAVR
ncbi:Collagen alpha-5(VI) chain [Actinoplanes sp. SE50]|nr:Collagen alpha-5(VI) chain [Actinoplanes sp. SE50/110]ATO81888.1 Collagen alpha-5(VI) chain [Actinoplanes sp. SE50]SLL99296.1 hypothetical protein ACSP50_2527 [Actinoplanes sp. SE50/110]